MVPFVLRMKYHMICETDAGKRSVKLCALYDSVPGGNCTGEYFQQSFQKDEIAGLAEVLELALGSRRMNRRSFRF